MPKLARLVAITVMLMVVACGAMTVRIDTEVSDETKISTTSKWMHPVRSP